MEWWNRGKKIDEDVYLNLMRQCGSASVVHGETLHQLHALRSQKKAQILVTVCEIVVFIFLTCAFTYSCKSLWDLKSEIGNLKEEVNREVFLKDRFSDILIRGEDDPFVLRQLLRSDAEDTSHNEENGMFKRKREIRLSNENVTEQSPSSGDKKSTPPMTSSSEEYYSDYPSRVSLFENPARTTRKPRRNHRKYKKYYRHPVSAEKFFTEIESTTSTPIQIRQSRTKLTDDSGSDKYKNDIDRKPLLQSYGSKESITREEALLRPFMTPHLLPESIIHLESRGNESYQRSLTPKETTETIPYNMITIHYAADTGHYTREKDAHYYGNGRIQMKTSIYKDWKPAHWTQGVDISKYFSLNQGKVSISVTGIYLIYAQVQYSNVQEVNGFAVVCNNQPTVQCITSSAHPDKAEIKSNTCSTSTTILLRSNDRIYLQDLHHGRHVVLTPERSYFGLILLSPLKEN